MIQRLDSKQEKLMGKHIMVIEDINNYSPKIIYRYNPYTDTDSLDILFWFFFIYSVGFVFLLYFTPYIVSVETVFSLFLNLRSFLFYSLGYYIFLTYKNYRHSKYRCDNVSI